MTFGSCERSELPPTVRHVLLTMSMYMKSDGSSAFPGGPPRSSGYDSRVTRNRRHQDKDIEKVLVEAESHGWYVKPGKGYWKLLCGCGEHKKWVALTPSGANYAKNLAKWLERKPCWDSEGES